MKKGTIITCPNCKIDIATLLTDLNHGMRINVSLFKSSSVEPIVDGEKLCCKDCGANYYHPQQGFHTGEGWVND